VDARTPRQTGAIISVEDGQATINLGSADGLSKGSQVEVFRDRTFKNRVGTLRLATVFREQARGDIEGNDLRVNHAVRVADRDHLQALLQQANDFEARGDLAGARHAAAQANAWSKSAKVTAWQKAGATELLAKLDFQAKDLGGAETHYCEALDIINTDPHASPDDLAEIRNNLAALAMMRKDYSSAEKLLEDGIVVLANQKLKAARANNLGVLAESRGDREQAESFYTQALAILPQNSPNERKIAEANLNRVKGLP